MKCHNCGFESETNFCPMCGVKMNSQPVQHTAPQPTAPITQNTKKSVYYGNPYVQIQEPVQENNQNQPPIMPNPQIPFNMQAATPPAVQPANSNGKSVAGIIVVVILGAVILAGTVISSYSCISKNISKEQPTRVFEYEPDFTNYHTGDAAKTSYGSITLKSMEEVEIVEKSVMYDGMYGANYNVSDFGTQYKITFTIENTSKKAITVSTDNFSVQYSDEYGTKDCPKITEIEDKYPQSITLKSGESEDLSLYYFVSTKAYSIVTRYRYADEATNKRYSMVFLDSIDYKSNEIYSSSISHPQNLPFGQIVVSNIVEKEEKDNSSKVYEFTFKIVNNSTDTIEVTSNDFAINGSRSDLTYNNSFLCDLTTDEVLKIEPNQIKEISVSASILNECDIIYIYYKFNNHSTNPDTPVGDSNYNVYWKTEKPQGSLF